jgi:hypothetical protein
MDCRGPRTLRRTSLPLILPTLHILCVRRLYRLRLRATPVSVIPKMCSVYDPTAVCEVAVAVVLCGGDAARALMSIISEESAS